MPLTIHLLVIRCIRNYIMNPETLHNTMLTILTILTRYHHGIGYSQAQELNSFYTSKDSKDGAIENVWNN